MNEIDNGQIAPTNPDVSYEYLKAWKFGEVSALIKFSLSEYGSSLELNHKIDFDNY